MTHTNLQFAAHRPSANHLVEDYLAGKREACVFYGGHYAAKGRLAEVAGKVEGSLDRRQVSDILLAQRTFGRVKGCKERLERFVTDGGYIIATGQQPVLFGGPLFIIYKCISTIKLASHAEKLLGVPVLPVFWNASEDHDLAEAASVNLPDLQNNLVRLTFSGKGENNRPLCQIEIDESIDSLFERLREITPETDFSRWVYDLLGSAYRRGSNLGHAFSDLLAGLFADYGLFIVDACHPLIREKSRELFETEIFTARQSTEAVRKMSDRLSFLGYPLQIKPQQEDTNLFLIRHGIREKLQLGAAGEEFRLKRSGDLIKASELRKLLDNFPVSFSPGVLMRPLVEAHLFSTLCYVAGPGEMSYYAQMPELYKVRKLQMPVIYPRFSGILVETKIARVLDKYGLKASDLRAGADELAGRLLDEQGEQALLLDETGKIRTFLEKSFARVMKQALRLDPTLEGPVKNTRASIESDLERLEKKSASAAKKRNKIIVAQLGKAALHLWPNGKPQEREIAGIYYLFRYGPELLSFLIKEAPVELK